MLQQTTTIAKMPSFLEQLESLPDPRDNRGKRHRLSFVLAGVALAVMAGRATMSSIHRFFQNRLQWLRQVTCQPEAGVPSRAQLPRIVARVEWNSFNEVLDRHFGKRVKKRGVRGWVAVDGKTLRGARAQTERIVLAVGHEGREILAQRRMSGPKVGEVNAARKLLRETGLEASEVTLDALHLNPTTTAQIHQADGTYLIQVKENQPALRAQVKDWARRRMPLGSVITRDRAHGRVESRRGTLVSLDGMHLHRRWRESGLRTLIVLERETVQLNSGKTTTETSYYVTNRQVTKDAPAEHRTLVEAIRNHWRVEADNNIRDVTFREDSIRTRDGNQGQILASLRTFAMRLFRSVNVVNFQAKLEGLNDSPKLFRSFLLQTGFL